MPLVAVQQIGVCTPSSPALDADEVVVLRPLEAGVNGKDALGHLRQCARPVPAPPFPQDQVALLRAGCALVQGVPAAHALCAHHGCPEALQPPVVLADLRAQGRPDGPSQWVLRAVALAGQAQQGHIGVVFQQPPGQVLLVPPGQDQDHLCPRRQAGFHTVVPFSQDPRPDGGAVRLLAVADGVVNDHQVAGVAGDAAANAAAAHPAPVSQDLKVRLFPAVPGQGDAEQLPPVFLDLPAVEQAELLGEAVAVAYLDNALIRVVSQVPAGQRLCQVHAFSVLGRLRDDEDVIGVSRFLLQKVLCRPAHQLRRPVWFVDPRVDILDIAVIILPGPPAQKLPFCLFRQPFPLLRPHLLPPPKYDHDPEGLFQALWVAFRRCRSTSKLWRRCVQLSLIRTR